MAILRKWFAKFGQKACNLWPVWRASMLLRSLALTLVIFVFATSAFAQFDSAQVSGTIQDSTGAILPGVDVTLVNVGTSQQRQAITNDAGLYNFPNVPVGEYRINATLQGFKAVQRTGVQVSAGVNIRVDVRLEVGEL